MTELIRKFGLSKVKFCGFVCEKYNEFALVILDMDTDMFLFSYDVAVGWCRCNSRDSFHEYYGEVKFCESTMNIVNVSSRILDWCVLRGVNQEWLKQCVYDEYGNYVEFSDLVEYVVKK